MGDRFPTETEGLVEAARPELVVLADGDVFDLEIGPVCKRIGDGTVRMLAYNGSIPGPTLKVAEGSTVTVRATNRGDHDTTVHWHGVRLENQYDGTHDTQSPIPIGETFEYVLEFPDPGVYWYHPHVREDYGQELGLYGNILVTPTDPEYWPPADREVPITLDDILIEDGRIAAFDPSETTHVAMGRFGNVMLVSGEPALSETVRRGEVVRLLLTNSANTRVFNVAVPGARMKLVGGDSGRYEREVFVDEVLLAPSERVVVDVLFDRPGELTLEHRTPGRRYPLATIRVSDEPVARTSADAFGSLRTNADMVAERERIAPFVDAAPDKTLAFVAELDVGVAGVPGEPVVYSCPMHPEIVRDEPGRCPTCGMRLLPSEAPAGTKLVPDGGQDHGHTHVDEHAHDRAQGIEWEDDMVEVNRASTRANMRWKLIDRSTGAENAAIDWRFQVGDQVKIRLVNEMDSDHPMPHPFHIHGAGRFLILGRDGVTEENLVWKDTVLVRTGETVDILLDVTNPGRWMAHCHIAEHHEGGMMLSFLVEDAD